VRVEARRVDDVSNSGDSSAAVPCRSNEDIETGLDRENGAVEDQVVQTRIILAGIEDDAGIGIARSIDLLLVSAGTGFVDALSNCLGDARLERSIKAHTKSIGPVAQYDHACPSENDPSGRPGYSAELRLTLRSKWLERLGHIGRNLPGPHKRRGVGEGHEDSFPAAGDTFVEALGDVGGRGQLSGHLSRDGAVKEWNIQPLGEQASDPVAIRTI
jgi:hypothetical protein